MQAIPSAWHMLPVRYDYNILLAFFLGRRPEDVFG
jgi:hypothetical protein